MGTNRCYLLAVIYYLSVWIEPVLGSWRTLALGLNQIAFSHRAHRGVRDGHYWSIKVTHGRGNNRIDPLNAAGCMPVAAIAAIAAIPRHLALAARWTAIAAARV